MDHPQQAKAKGAAAAPPLYGDVLDAVVSRVPALDLVPASRVSRQWRRAVRSSVSSSSRLSPWLLLHPLKPRRSPSSSSSSSYAFDPHSRTWLHGPLLPTHNNNNDNNNNYYFPGLLLPVVACGGSRLCALSLSAVSVSADPFGAAAWRRFDAPRVWRQDPVVALAAPTSTSSSCWQPCEPIPAAFDGSTSAHWLSAAASERRVYVVERRTGRASWLDPASRTWGRVRLLRPDGSPPTSPPGQPAALPSATVSSWPARGGLLGWPCLIGLCAAGDCGYVYNQAEPRKGMVMYQVERDKCKAGMIRRWEWVPCPTALQQDHRYYYYAADKVALGCSAVGLDDLAGALTYLRAR
uniref:F-box domain-containing protein n=1 Tax=Ananas comosus var. bracteatus TaxID=296719 RepID=A0A6V7PVR4_ANACO|nr:unnamed protein product [Ananas comosus var. bracteatus]